MNFCVFSLTSFLPIHRDDIDVFDLKENTFPDTEHVIFCENLGNGQFKLHDNIHPEQTKIVNEAFFAMEYQRLQYAKCHHEELNDKKKQVIKYKNRNQFGDQISKKGESV